MTLHHSRNSFSGDPQGDWAIPQSARTSPLSNKLTTDKPPSGVSRSNLATRLLTAGIAAPVILGLIFVAPPWAWYLLVLLISAGAAWELLSMTHPEDAVARSLGTLCCVLVSVAIYFGGHDSRVLLTVLLAIPCTGLLIPLWRLGEIETATTRSMAGVAVPLYVGLLTTIALVRKDLPWAEGSGYALLTLVIAWMADTGGYFAGRAFGKHKLYEAVSPKKTREGFFGGLLGSVLGMLVAHFWFLPTLSLSHGLLLALLGGSFGQLGDLCESLLKRSSRVKDSGTILPGHGGILDRVDGVLFVAPLVYLYTLWWT
jgi:phosphatidate cytidylyltransferase